jgi:hypothetical protein
VQLVLALLLLLQEMDARMMEVLVFVDGVDAMTSKAMQARRSYQPSEMLMNEQVGWRQLGRGEGGGGGRWVAGGGVGWLSEGWGWLTSSEQ